jgi:hypothetical protein
VLSPRKFVGHIGSDLEKSRRWLAWWNSRQGVICVSARSFLGQGPPPPRRRCAAPCVVRRRRALTIETSTRRPRYAVPGSVARRSRNRPSRWLVGPKRPLHDDGERIAEMLSRVGARADRHRWPDELTGHCQSFPPRTFPGRTTSASNRVRTAGHAQIEGLSSVFASAQPRRNAFEQLRRAQRETVERPCHVGITGRRGLLRRLACRTRLNDDAVTRVIDRKCAAVQELRHANQWIRGAVPREIVAETFHRPCNRPATTRPPTCKNA